MQALWHLDEGTGTTITDSSGNSNNGTISDGTWVGTDGGQWGSSAGVSFVTGDSLSFDGNNDYVTVPDSTTLRPGTNDFTLSFWIKIPFTLSASYPGIITKGTVSAATAHTWGFLQVFNTTNQIRFYQSSDAGGTWDVALFSSNLANGWHFITARRSGATTQLYLDGSYYYEDTSAGSDLSSTADILIGKSALNYFSSTLDEIRLYNRALSADEISRQYIRSKYASTAPAWASPDSQEVYALTVSTQAATLIAPTGATLNGLISGFGGENSATVYFKYGLSQDNLNQTTASQVMSGYGSFSQAITGLVSDTAYYFQAVVTNNAGIAYGTIYNGLENLDTKKQSIRCLFCGKMRAYEQKKFYPQRES